ncbi:hypothetical protein [Sporolactobacillus sp. THM19-2]|nr:hypothetical protein [Sporolactobacillus sp. THM19-2]
MPFHQKVDTETRLTRMIEDMGITLHPKKPEQEMTAKKKVKEKASSNKK